MLIYGIGYSYVEEVCVKLNTVEQAGHLHLQVLDSPGASSKSQNSIFGCVESKQRPSSPATDTTQINHDQLFTIVIR